MADDDQDWDHETLAESRILRKREVEALERIATALELPEGPNRIFPAPPHKDPFAHPLRRQVEINMRMALVEWLRDYDVAMDALGVPDRGSERYEAREMLHALAELVETKAVPPAPYNTRSAKARFADWMGEYDPIVEALVAEMGAPKLASQRRLLDECRQALRELEALFEAPEAPEAPAAKDPPAAMPPTHAPFQRKLALCDGSGWLSGQRGDCSGCIACSKDVCRRALEAAYAEIERLEGFVDAWSPAPHTPVTESGQVATSAAAPSVEASPIRQALLGQTSVDETVEALGLDLEQLIHFLDQKGPNLPEDELRATVSLLEPTWKKAKPLQTEDGQVPTCAHTCGRTEDDDWSIYGATICPQCRKGALAAGHTPVEIAQAWEYPGRAQEESDLQTSKDERHVRKVASVIQELSLIRGHLSDDAAMAAFQVLMKHKNVAHTCGRENPDSWGIGTASTCPRCFQRALEVGHSPSEIDLLAQQQNEVISRVQGHLQDGQTHVPPTRPDVRWLRAQTRSNAAWSHAARSLSVGRSFRQLCDYVLHLEKRPTPAETMLAIESVLPIVLTPAERQMILRHLERGAETDGAPDPTDPQATTPSVDEDDDIMPVPVEEDEVERTEIEIAARKAYWKEAMRGSGHSRAGYIHGFEDGAVWRQENTPVPVLDLREQHTFRRIWDARATPSSQIDMGIVRLITDSERQAKMIHGALTSHDDYLLFQLSFHDIASECPVDIERPWEGVLVWMTPAQRDRILSLLPSHGYPDLAQSLIGHSVFWPGIEPKPADLDALLDREPDTIYQTPTGHLDRSVPPPGWRWHEIQGEDGKWRRSGQVRSARPAVADLQRAWEYHDVAMRLSGCEGSIPRSGAADRAPELTEDSE